jgi:hypothetical protein
MSNYFSKTLTVFLVLVGMYAAIVLLGIIKDTPLITAILTFLGLVGLVFFEAYLSRKLGSDDEHSGVAF